MRSVTAIACCLLLVVLFVLTIQAQQSESSSVQPLLTNQRDLDKEKIIWQRLEKIAPKAVPTFKAATEAMDAKDHQKAIRLYEDVLKQAPDFDPAQRRLGYSLIGAGDQAKGLAMLEKAFATSASPENAFGLAQQLAFSEEKPSNATLDRALSLATIAAQGNLEEPDYQLLRAQIALTAENETAFREATLLLSLKHPDLMQTHYFSAICAAMDQNPERAETEIKKAEALGLPKEVAARFLSSSGVQTQAQMWRYVYLVLWVTVAWLVGLGGLFVVGKLFSNLTLRSIEQADPNVSDQQTASIRTWYRRLINIAGVYYYISLPVVVLLVIGVVAAIFGAFWMIGRIPIKLAGILLIGALITIFKMIQSLFIKIESEDPGRALSQEEAPKLWALTREVADVLGTRPIDEIRITPGCEMAVYEKGGFREKMQDRAQRNLILGVGVLNGMRLNAFRAVLAHEYGHFSNRDTAGGDVALRVERDMSKFFYAMAFAGQAVWYNIAFQFLRVYHFLFRRITHGATRLQEVLADRVAVYHFSAASFEEGLRHVIRREIEFNQVASNEIESAQLNQRALSNLYQLPAVKSTDDEVKIVEAVNEIITQPTTEDDTHPSPVDRFRLASRIVCQATLPPDGEVWDLFADREALTTEMSLLIDQRVKDAVNEVVNE